MKHLVLALALFTTALLYGGHTAADNTPGNTVRVDWVSVEPYLIIDLGDLIVVFDSDGVKIVDGHGPIGECVTAAITACGEGQICRIIVTWNGGVSSCEFTCRDGDGGCPGVR